MTLTRISQVFGLIAAGLIYHFTGDVWMLGLALLVFAFGMAAGISWWMFDAPNAEMPDPPHTDDIDYPVSQKVKR